jgi:hypothetical protein
MTDLPDALNKPVLSRRNFLKITAGVTAAAMLAPTLAACSPSDYPALADSVWQQSFNSGDQAALQRELVRYATMAPSGHNTQPWRFTIQNNVIRIIPDKRRSLAVVDPDDREMYISLGCALENLALAAAYNGLTANADLFPAGEPECLRITLAPDGGPGEPGLFDAIPLRQCTRSEYSSQPLSEDERSALQAVQADGGVSLHLFDGAERFEPLIALVKAGNQAQYSNKAFVEELISWLRFNDAEATSTRDGLFSRCSGNPSVPRWLGKIFVSTSTPDAMSKTDEKNIRSSAGMAVFASQEDTPAAWVNSGRLVQRFALTAASLNVKMAFLNQPVEVPEVRQELAGLLGGSLTPQLVVRYGHAEAMPVSLRRPVEDVLA